MLILEQFAKSQNRSDIYDACRLACQRHFGIPETPGPVNLNAIARANDIEVVYTTDTQYEGMIERDASGRATIVLRKGMPRQRERFTLAHELGHWLLQQELIGTTKGQLFRGLSTNRVEMRQEEYLANLLAAELLMPFHATKGCFDWTHPLQSTFRVCSRFGVSRIAAVRRVADLFSTNLLLLQLLGYKSKSGSIAQIDDAVLATAKGKAVFARNTTRLLEVYSFSLFEQEHTIEMKLRTIKGDIATAFETSFRSRPIPHSFALGVVAKWPLEQGNLS